MPVDRKSQEKFNGSGGFRVVNRPYYAFSKNHLEYRVEMGLEKGKARADRKLMQKFSKR